MSFSEARDRAWGLRERMDLRVASYWVIRFKEDWMTAVQVVVLLVRAVWRVGIVRVVMSRLRLRSGFVGMEVILD